MKVLPLYNILSYILLPFAALFGLIGLIGLLAALANPTALLGVFVMAATVIYTIASFAFLTKGIRQARPCKASLKDWIKVNAFVSIIFSLLILVESLGVIVKPGLLREGLERTMSMPGFKLPPQVTFEMMLKVMKGFFVFMTFFSTILLIHIAITFRLLKAYHYVFDKPE